MEPNYQKPNYQKIKPGSIDWGVPVVIVGIICDCPKCRREKTKSDEQAALRGYHGRAYEYVWSDVLQSHVLIGESLKSHVE